MVKLEIVNNKKIFIILFCGLTLLAFVVVLKLFVFGKRIEANAAIQILSSPRTTVFLNDKEVGQTPYKVEKMKAGDYKLKLVPTGSFNNISPWETQIKLTDGILTFVSREMGATIDESSGQILTMESLASNKSAEVAVVSDPDGASISIDGINNGKTSAIFKNLEPGDHNFVISLPGYSDEVVRGGIVAGFRSNIIVKLRKNPFQKDALIVRPTSELIATNSGQFIKPYVVINQTPLGFLRVRTAPDPTSSESAKVYPGQKYSLLEEMNNWTKIRMASISGWVSDQYIQKIK